MQKLFSIFSILFLHLFFCTVFAQSTKDSNIVSTKKITDTSKKAVKPFSPKTATIRSAILPGWGQAYNKKYWKIPIIYAALGTTTYLFFDNLNTYKSLKQSYIYKTDDDPANDDLIPPEYQNLNANSLQLYRNEYRKYVDYSVLFFLLFWGLNVVDATVDAHLKAFDVSDNLSLQIHPGYSPLANTNGISFVFDIHSKKRGVK
jgi:hypothetical protein